MACFWDCSLCIVLNLHIFSSYSHFSRKEVVETEHKSSAGKFPFLKVFMMILLSENPFFVKSPVWVAGFYSAQLYFSSTEDFPYCVMAEVLWQCFTLSTWYSTRALQFCGVFNSNFLLFCTGPATSVHNMADCGYSCKSACLVCQW